MSLSPRVMLLVDADNVSADVIEQAVERTLAEHGAVHVRRAYCNAETALKQQSLFKRLSIRPMVNLSAGKNSTDIALAVDAIDLVIAERPDVVVLVSSDSDFAPLVIRLREKGCRVCGIGQQGKTGEETVAIYDSFVDLQHHSSSSKAAVARPAARQAAKAEPAPKPAAKRTARAPRRTKAEAPAPAPRAPVLPDDVLHILDAVAELGMGNKVELNVAAERLRAAKLLGKSASSPKLFKKYPELFLLTPEKTPNKVQYIGPMPV
ncbi:NYN domain-containing protein [Variovorax saccharolyticus]|uniref:NYN domain-containing protein n=1 Tax=Variovorax saccharolyticus TaxID=3053516 RepID=UPI002574D8D8|nr:NYN domain-containing protein [Variovorax sp. J31P216]MDM0024657.1 NYN domain-containing protein [Variovorax sp. J31P216]